MCVRWRNTPELSAAKMTGVIFVVAMWTQRSHLVVYPHLIWQSICRPAIITETACHQTAINAWPAKLLLCTKSQHIEGSHVRKRVQRWLTSKMSKLKQILPAWDLPPGAWNCCYPTWSFSFSVDILDIWNAWLFSTNIHEYAHGHQGGVF